MKVILLGTTGEDGKKYVFTQDRRVDLTITDDEIWGEIIRRVNSYETAPHVEPTRTLAAYAIALLYGFELADFEKTNLLELAASVGAVITPSHIEMRERVSQARENMQKELSALRNAAKERRSLWQRIFG